MSGEPLRLEPVAGRPLRELLFERGVEFPCAGVSQCGGCRIRVLAGEVPISEAMHAALTPAELAAGWRLGCVAEASGPVTLEVEQWAPEILDDRAGLPHEPGDGLGVVIDLGTTTIVAQLVDRRTGTVAAVESALNAQAAHGADLMSRIRHDLAHPGALTALVRRQIGEMVASLARGNALEEVLLVGNTAMHHLFCGLPVEPLAAVPFRSPHLGEQTLDALELGWTLPACGPVRFLGGLGGFVGSDLLAGIAAVGMHQAESPAVLMDLGTNGEIALGDRRRIRVASAAAGPAFEGGRIGLGMRAGTGAIDRVWVEADRPQWHVLGGGPARGVCGSGLVDAVAAGLELGWIGPNGRIVLTPRRIDLAPGVHLSQSDVRELQLAKGALAAGLELLGQFSDRLPGRWHLAGAFGNYVRAGSARRIGLLPATAVEPEAAGNTALRGARMLLLAPSRRETLLAQIFSCVEHVELAALPEFQDVFVDAMGFPAT